MIEYRWEDVEGDEGVLEPFAGPHPHIAAILKIHGGPGDYEVGVYIDVDQAREIIAYLKDRLAEPRP